MWQQLINLIGSNPLETVKDLVQTFKLPPEQQLEFEKTMTQAENNLVTNLAKIDADDRNSARLREVNAKDTRNVFTLAVLVTGGFFGTLGYMLVEPVPPGSERVVDVMLGALGTAWVAVVSYYFGSSSGSNRKHDLIDRLVRK